MFVCGTNLDRPLLVWADRAKTLSWVLDAMIGEVDTCSACGTKFKLGAKASSSVVLSSDGPPKGGAAVA